jgi:hypothetical protein
VSGCSAACAVFCRCAVRADSKQTAVGRRANSTEIADKQNKFHINLRKHCNIHIKLSFRSKNSTPYTLEPISKSLTNRNPNMNSTRFRRDTTHCRIWPDSQSLDVMGRNTSKSSLQVRMLHQRQLQRQQFQLLSNTFLPYRFFWLKTRHKSWQFGMPLLTIQITWRLLLIRTWFCPSWERRYLPQLPLEGSIGAVCRKVVTFRKNLT